MIDHRSYTDNLNSFEIKARIKTALFLCIAAMINHVLVIVRNCYLTHNLGQNKKKQLTPFPPKKKKNDEGAKEQKRAILASLKWEGRGGSSSPHKHSEVGVNVRTQFQ